MLKQVCVTQTKWFLFVFIYYIIFLCYQLLSSVGIYLLQTNSILPFSFIYLLITNQ